jgi:hypothetical protein
VEEEHSAMAGLVRVTALCFADGVRFAVPAGNRLRTAGDLAEIRALLAGWPRASAHRLKQHFGPAAPAAAADAIEATLDAWARDPELESADPECWSAAAGAAS